MEYKFELEILYDGMCEKVPTALVEIAMFPHRFIFGFLGTMALLNFVIRIQRKQLGCTTNN